MKIENQNDQADIVTITKSVQHPGLVWLGIGEGTSSPHVHLKPSEVRAVAYGLMSYVEQVSEHNPTIDAGEFTEHVRA